MKRLPLVILLIGVLLATVVAGCGRAPRYDGRLVAADSLMRDCPDSALAVVEGVCRDSLAADGDRAYRDLLLTQARYRCYVTATSDSTINRALAYYRAHPEEKEKLTRAYIYKGAVKEELNHPDSAMLYYKHAEANADTTDFFNLGYTNIRIAQLYQSQYSNDSEVVKRMKIAAGYFMATKDTDYLVTAIGTQGCYPQIIGKDSAYYYLRWAIDLSKRIQSNKRLQYQSKLAGLYFYSDDYCHAKDVSMDIIRNCTTSPNEQQFYYYAARSFIHLNELDSAQWVISRVPSPQNAVDSMNLFLTMAEFALATRHFHDHQHYSFAAQSIENRITEVSRNSKLPVSEVQFEAIQHEKYLTDKADRHVSHIFIISLLTILALFAAAQFIAKKLICHYQALINEKKLEVERLIEEIKNTKNQLESEKALNDQHIRRLDDKNKELEESNRRVKELENVQESLSSNTSDIVKLRIDALNEIYQSIRIKNKADEEESGQSTIGRTVKDLYEKRGILHTTPKTSFWSKLRKSIDGEFNGIVSFVEKKYPKLSEKDLQLFMLICADFPNSIIKLCMSLTSDVTVSKYKKRLFSERIGIDVKIDDFIQLYLQGKLG